MSTEASHKDMHDVKQRFYQAAKTAYPNVAEPGTVWVLMEVLGWNWHDVMHTSIDGFSPEGYRRLIRDEDGHFPATTVTRKWTKEEKAKLREWWWLLGYE